MFLLVPAHPGFPGQIPQSRKTVVLCVCNGFDMKVRMHQCSALSPLLFVIVKEALSREFEVASP